MPPKILIGKPIEADQLQKLNEGFEVDCIPRMRQRRRQVLERIADYDALLAMSHKVGPEIMDQGKKLKIIANYGVGVDKIDLDYARKKGIVVTNTPRSTTEPTANLAMGLILALMRNIVLGDRDLRLNRLEGWDLPDRWGHGPDGKTLGILGMGRIGKALAKRAAVFGMDIRYHNRHRLSIEEEQAYQAQYVSKVELFSQSDVLSLHVPLSAETRDLIGMEDLRRMKPNAYLVNTARGGIIHEPSLIEVLQNKSIAGAALDVFPHEPQVNPLYFDMDHVIINPHIGTGTHEARQAMFEEAFGNIVAWFNGVEMTSRVA